MLNRSGRLPDYLIVGAQKSGTTSLSMYTGAHPEVFCTPDEVHYFDRHLDRGVDWYRSCFQRAGDKAIVGEPTPEYLYLEEVPPRIAALVPDARLLIILRQPVDRAYSHYWHNRTRGGEPLEFVEALEAEPARLAGARSPRERGRYAYLDRGRYVRQLERLCRSFPRHQIHVLLSDDLRLDRANSMKAVYRFLGVDDSVAPAAQGIERNQFIEYRSQRVRPLIRRLPRPAQRLAGRLNIRYATYPPMDPGLRQRLTEGFADDIRELETWLDRDLAFWRTS